MCSSVKKKKKRVKSQILEAVYSFIFFKYRTVVGCALYTLWLRNTDRLVTACCPD